VQLLKNSIFIPVFGFIQWVEMAASPDPEMLAPHWRM
jgi:hypothetical protein